MGANAQTSVPDFTAGQVLTAAQMTEVNTGIPVFADSSARDAAFGGTGEKTLAEGQYAYLESTNATQYYDGAAWQSVGAVGLNAIVPTSVTVGSGSASTSANGTVTFTGASSVSLNGVFSAAYDMYQMVFYTTAVSADMTLSMRLRVGGADNSTAVYNNQELYAELTTLTGLSNSTQTNFPLNSVDTSNPSNQAFTYTFWNPFPAALTQVTRYGGYLNSSGNRVLQSQYMWHTGATSFDGFSIICNTGNIGGKMAVYGYAL